MVGLLGCADAKEEFIGHRALDACSESWPICDSVAGCVLGAQSYVEGRFPGVARFVITVPEPANVYVGLYLENVTAAGSSSSIDWYEDSCRARFRETIDGQDFVGESQRVGYISRMKTLIGLGDHLIEIRSDSEGDYSAKVDVIPTRLDGS